jgi:hypothetical protein
LFGAKGRFICVPSDNLTTAPCRLLIPNDPLGIEAGAVVVVVVVLGGETTAVLGAVVAVALPEASMLLNIVDRLLPSNMSPTMATRQTALPISTYSTRLCPAYRICPEHPDISFSSLVYIPTT